MSGKMIDLIKNINVSEVFPLLKYIVIFITYIASFYYWFNEKTQYFATLLMVFMNAIVFCLVTNNFFKNKSKYNNQKCFDSIDFFIVNIFNDTSTRENMKKIIKNPIVYYISFLILHVIQFIVFVLYFIIHDSNADEISNMNKMQKLAYDGYRAFIIVNIILCWIWGALLSVPSIMTKICELNQFKGPVLATLGFLVIISVFTSLSIFFINVIITTYSPIQF